MAGDPDQGQLGAHTRAAAAENGARTPEAAGGDRLLEKLEAFQEAARGADLDLFAALEQSAEAGQEDTLTVMARSVTEARRGRGRPIGAKNLRNTQVFDLLEAQGHRAPEHVLSLIASIDPLVMAEVMAKNTHFAAALDKIIKAAAELLPYKLAKRTPDAEAPPPAARPVIVFNQLPQGHFGGSIGGALSVSPRPIMDNDADSQDNSKD